MPWDRRNGKKNSKPAFRRRCALPTHHGCEPRGICRALYSKMTTGFIELRLGASNVPLDLDWFSGVELKSKFQREDVGSRHPDITLKVRMLARPQVAPMCPVTRCSYPAQSTPLEGGWSPSPTCDWLADD